MRDHDDAEWGVADEPEHFTPEDYEAARSQDSESIEALLGLAVTYRDMGDYKAARRWIGSASRLAPI